MRICRKCSTIMENDMQFCPECGIRYLLCISDIYSEIHCPIVAAEHVLFADGGNLFGVIVWGSNSEKVISACSVRIRCCDQLGDIISDEIVKYYDLAVGCKELFGQDKIFALADPATRYIRIIPEKVLFEDGSMWNGNDTPLTKSDAHDEFKKIIAESMKQQIYQNIDADIKHDAELEEEAKEIWTQLENCWEVYKKASEWQHARVKELERQGVNVIHAIELAVEEAYDKFHASETAANHKRDLIIAAHPEIRVPSNVTMIEFYMFDNCKQLQSIKIPHSVHKIDGFRSCSNLRSATVPKRLKLKEYAFPDATVVIREERPQKIADRKRTELREMERQERRERFEAYWQEHAEKKAQLESERDQMQSKIKQLKEQIAPYNQELDHWKAKRYATTASQNELKAVEQKISSLEYKYSQLGIFKGKEKKAIFVQIDELNARIPSLNQSIESEKKEQLQLSTEKLREIEETLTPIKAEITAAQTRINEINDELSKDR